MKAAPSALNAPIPPPANGAAGAAGAAGASRRSRKARQTQKPKRTAAGASLTSVTTDAQARALATALRRAKGDAGAAASGHADAEDTGTTSCSSNAPNTTVKDAKTAHRTIYLSAHANADDSLHAVTLQYGVLAAAIDTAAVSAAGLHAVVTAVCAPPACTIVVQSAAQLRSIGRAAWHGKAHVPNWPPNVFDLQLGHELQTGQYGYELPCTHANVEMRGPAGMPFDQDTTRALCASMEELRARFAMLSTGLPAAMTTLWMRASHRTAERLARLPHVHDVRLPDRQLVFTARAFAPRSACLVPTAERAATDTSMRDSRAEVLRLVERLPDGWRARVGARVADALIDVQLDVGRPAFAFTQGGRVMLSEHRADVVTEGVLADVLAGLSDGVDGDNRGGMDGTLHRVSVIRGRGGREVGATLRVGRHIYGVAAILYDVLLSDRHGGDSVLLLGAPGSGKTTMGRDVARLLAEQFRVIIIDSSDEMAGPGVIPHAAVGDARRLAVVNGKRGLAGTLVEAVENHTPDVLIVDELSDHAEVRGASTARQRGVRLFASAHGDLRSIVKNVVLRNLVGGVERITVGDAQCKRDLGGKLRSVRAGDAVFEVVVEMGVLKGDRTALRIVHDVHQAVDDILMARRYRCELRWRGDDGQLFSRNVLV